jgi:hypothetical protein
MYYDFSITIPANTTQLAPVTQNCHLTHGIIHHLEIDFPYGCAGLAYLQILHSLHQIWPTNPDGAFNADGYTISTHEHYEITDTPYIITLSGWNLDDTFSHTLQIRFAILPADILLPEKGLANVLHKLQRRLHL